MCTYLVKGCGCLGDPLDGLSLHPCCGIVLIKMLKYYSIVFCIVLYMHSAKNKQRLID